MVNELHQLILKIFPDATVDMRYKMPTYHHGDVWIALANQKHYVSLYTCSAYPLEIFKSKHPKIKTGKGCINFKPNNVLPLDDIQVVIERAIVNPKGQ